MVNSFILFYHLLTVTQHVSSLCTLTCASVSIYFLLLSPTSLPLISAQTQHISTVPLKFAYPHISLQTPCTHTHTHTYYSQHKQMTEPYSLFPEQESGNVTKGKKGTFGRYKELKNNHRLIRDTLKRTATRFCDFVPAV